MIYVYRYHNGQPKIKKPPKIKISDQTVVKSEVPETEDTESQDFLSQAESLTQPQQTETRQQTGTSVTIIEDLQTFKPEEVVYIRPHKCDACDKDFPDIVSLNNHIKILHENCKFYECDQCDKLFSMRYLLTKHLKEVHSDMMLACDKCDAVYKTKNGLDNHTKVCFALKDVPMVIVDQSMDELVKQHACDQCDMTYLSHVNLRRHIRTKHTPLTHPCDTCDKTFQFMHSLQKHKISCKTGYTGYTGWKTNVKPGVALGSLAIPYGSFVNNPKKKKYQCQICDRVLKKRYSLAKHIESVHEGYRPYECTRCNSFFKEAFKLKLHNKAIHNGEDFSKHTPHPNRYVSRLRDLQLKVA
jgi:uncharacterized Zn-finger protein